MHHPTDKNIEQKRPIWIKLFGTIILVFVLLLVMNFIVKKEVSSFIEKTEIPQAAQHSSPIKKEDK